MNIIDIPERKLKLLKVKYYWWGWSQKPRNDQCSVAGPRNQIKPWKLKTTTTTTTTKRADSLLCEPPGKPSGSLGLFKLYRSIGGKSYFRMEKKCIA